MIDVKIEVKEEEEDTYVRGDQLSMKEAEMMVTITKEESSLDISTGKYYIHKIQHFTCSNDP